MSEQISVPDAHVDETMKVTCRYGLEMYRIYRALFHLASIRQGFASEHKSSYLAEYDDAWNNLNLLLQEHPQTCPSLYSKTLIRRTWTEVADDVVNEMR